MNDAKRNPAFHGMHLLRLIVLVTAGYFLSGCTSAPSALEEDRSVEQLLSELPDRESWGASERCLRTWEYRRVEILDNKHLLFYGAHGKVWLNRLRQRCVGLRPSATLRFDLHSGQVCNLDSVTAIEPRLWFWDRVSGTCSLGSFEPLPLAQAELLKDQMRRQR